MALLYFVSQPAITDTQQDAGTTIVRLIESQHHPLLAQQDFSKQSSTLKRLYEMHTNRLIWLGDGVSPKNRNDALAILSDAMADGLSPGDYDAEPIRHFLERASALPVTATNELATIDLALSISILRFIEDIHSGRVDPRELNYPLAFGAQRDLDAAALLTQHLDTQSLSDLPKSAAPKFKQYGQLKQELAKLRQTAIGIPYNDLVFDKHLRPGDRHPALPDLRRRLKELGELDGTEITPSGDDETLYDEATTTAVKHLQEQQGLNADGILGKQTLALLNQTPAEKMASIELAMERLRWLPAFPDGPLIVVNIPAFQLWAFRSPDDTTPLGMKVIVGKADDTQTPMLWEEMKYLEFNPYWNIPTSIMSKEILPKMLSDYEFLSSQDIELIAPSSDSEQDYFDNIVQDLSHGKARGRQRPGKKNPLGRVKFIFPNHADVYLHDTPNKSLFNKDRRDLSHGCVRVSKPDKLAEFVLNDPDNWNIEAIEEAMSATKTRRVTLKKPIPVLFFYTTAYVDQDNKPHFYPDIYDQDRRLLNALNKSQEKNPNSLMMGKNSQVSG